jgi:hypothetical protein
MVVNMVLVAVVAVVLKMGTIQGLVAMVETV